MTSSRKILRSLCLALSLSPAAVAQETPDAAPKVQYPKVEGDKVTGLKFENINVLALVRIYEKMTGKPVVTDTSVQGNLNVDTDVALTKKQAIHMLEQALTLNGFSLVVRPEETLVLGPGKPTRSAAIPIYYDEKSIPEGVSVISYLFDLKHVDPTELANTLNQYLATGQPYTSFLPLPRSRALLVTETTPSIRNIIGLVKKIDVPEAEDEKNPTPADRPVHGGSDGH